MSKKFMVCGKLKALLFPEYNECTRSELVEEIIEC